MLAHLSSICTTSFDPGHCANMATANREGSGVAWQQLSSDRFSHIATKTVRGDHQHDHT